MTENLNTDVVVIGAGFAGLAASLELTLANKKVILLEASPTPGGRARTIPWGNINIDNGQHLLIGAYKNILQHLNKIGVAEETMFAKSPLSLNIFDASMNYIKLSIKDRYLLPLALNNLFSFLMSRGLTTSEKLQVISFLCLQKLNKYKIHKDIPLKKYLEQKSQSPSIIEKFWEPIALAALTTPIEISSTKLFLNVLKESFDTDKSASNFLFARKDLSEIFAYPTIEWLKSKGQTVFLHTRAKDICTDTNSVTTKSNLKITAKKIIIATSCRSLKPLLSSHPKMANIVDTTSKIDFEPIMTIYLKFEKPVSLSNTMIGRIGKGIVGQWYFDRAIQGEPNIIGVIISGRGEYEKISSQELVEKVYKETEPFCQGNKLVDTKIVKEKFAAFSATPSNNRLRPSHITPCRDIFLTGDYTINDYPATLEGAVINGKKAAAEVIKHLDNHHG